MHDIVRDFTLASQADSDLALLQRSFIATLVSGVSSKPSGTTAQATVSAYASSSLGHHLRGTLSAPFANDALASALFLHESPSVVAQALETVNRGDVDSLIDHYLNTGQSWPASRLCFSFWNGARLTDDQRLGYILKTISSLEHVDIQSQPGALTVEVMTRYKFVLSYPSHRQVKQQAERLMAVAEMSTKEIDQVDMTGLVNAKNTVGHILIGHFVSPYESTVDIEQAKKGARMIVEVHFWSFDNRKLKIMSRDTKRSIQTQRHCLKAVSSSIFRHVLFCLVFSNVSFS